LKLVSPSTAIKQSYLDKSESNLSSAKLLSANEKLEESVTMAYYSMYNSVQALLYVVGIKCQNHTASIILLKELFALDNTEILDAKKERIDKQYYVGFKIAKTEVIELTKTAEEFNAKLLDFIEKLNADEINRFREKFRLGIASSHR
jgi:uncharacterized protein (UPF0332 family)